MLQLMMSASTGVPFRAGFDHATSPELVGASFGGWSRLRAESRAFRETPRDDMISRLVNSTVDDRPLTDDELYQLGFLLYLAGLDTTANVLTYSFRFLAGRPDLRSLLRDEPDKNSARRGGVPALVLHRVDRPGRHQ
jgi:cytochrome P450